MCRSQRDRSFSPTQWNELLWIAARIGPDASEGIDIETLMKADALARVDISSLSQPPRQRSLPSRMAFLKGL